MNIILSSSPIDDSVINYFLQEINKPAKEIAVALIPTARNYRPKTMSKKSSKVILKN